MIFALGLITGLILAVLILAALAYIQARTGEPERTITRITEKAEAAGRKAVILNPKSQSSKVRDQITKEYSDRGEEAPLIL